MKKTKKLLLLITALISFFSFTNIVHAAGIYLSANASTTSTVVGNSITVTFSYSSENALGAVVYSMNYDSSKLTLTSGTQSNALSYTGDQKSDSARFTFKAISSGSAQIEFKINEALDFDGNSFSGNKSVSKTINIKTQAEIVASYSKNNNFKMCHTSSPFCALSCSSFTVSIKLRQLSILS